MVCLSFWRYCYAVVLATIDEIRKRVAHGHACHPDRATRPRHMGGQWLKADTWLHSVYTDHSEPLAETTHDADNINKNVALDADICEFELVGVDGHQCWLNAILVPDPKDNMKNAHVCTVDTHPPHTTFADLYSW